MKIDFTKQYAIHTPWEVSDVIDLTNGGLVSHTATQDDLLEKKRRALSVLTENKRRKMQQSQAEKVIERWMASPSYPIDLANQIADRANTDAVQRFAELNDYKRESEADAILDQWAKQDRLNRTPEKPATAPTAPRPPVSVSLSNPYGRQRTEDEILALWESRYSGSSAKCNFGLVA